MQTAVRQMLCPKHHVLSATTQAETMARICGVVSYRGGQCKHERQNDQTQLASSWAKHFVEVKAERRVVKWGLLYPHLCPPVSPGNTNSMKPIRAKLAPSA